MPRRARIDAARALQHIICRGIQRCRIYQDDSDRQDFLSRLGYILRETRTPCYAWPLMPNHFHLLLRTGDAPISIVMKRLLTGNAVTFNRRNRRSGHLFQNRYKSILCQEDTSASPPLTSIWREWPARPPPRLSRSAPSSPGSGQNHITLGRTGEPPAG